MGFGEVMGLVDALIPDDDSEGDGITTSEKEDYHSLWKRMHLVTRVLIREGRRKDAGRCMIAFFTSYPDIGVLEKDVEKAEEMITTPAETHPQSTDS